MKETTLPDKYNYSIAFTKMFLSFCVVCCHYWNPENATFYPVVMLRRMCAVAVPIFIIMSFFLTEKIYADENTSKIKGRAWRLIYPYFSWALLYFFGYTILDRILKLIGFEQGLQLSFTYHDLLWQMAFGSDRFLCPQLWYQFDLIVLTALVWIIFRYLKRYAWQIMIFLGIISYYIQYSGINNKLFGEYEYEVRWSTGRLIEVLPLVCIGLFLANKNFLERIKVHRLYVAVICIISLLIIAYGGLFTTPPDGFGYGGTYIAFYATIAFTLFYQLPFEKLPNIFKKILAFLSKYSFGVFCIHFGVGYCWNAILCPRYGWKYNSFRECIGIYIICIFVSWSISLLPTKYARQIVE